MFVHHFVQLLQNIVLIIGLQRIVKFKILCVQLSAAQTKNISEVMRILVVGFLGNKLEFIVTLKIIYVKN